MIASLEEKKSELIRSIGSRVENKLRLLNDQKGECSENLQIMTGLLDYVDEVCQEDDPAVFLLISSSISSRFKLFDVIHYPLIVFMYLKIGQNLSFEIDCQP